MAKLIDPREAGPKPPFRTKAQDFPGDTSSMNPQPDHGEESYAGSDRLKDRVALITGGDSGIGRAVAIAFAREGADVAFSYLPGSEESDAAETTKWIDAAQRRSKAVGVDLSQASGCTKLVKSIGEAFGRIDILVNNAAFQGKTAEKFEDLNTERVRRTMATNVEAVFNVTREALSYMGPGGVIINTTSIQGVDPSAAILDYACTKAALIDFTKGLAQELIKRGIRVNAVAPGPVWTPFIPQSFSAEATNQFGKNNPMGRPAQPAELAPAYVYLASDQSRFVVGAVLPVTGGAMFD